MTVAESSELHLKNHPRDYSLTGPLNRQAVEIGLANAEWYKTDIPRARMKELMQRSDGPATVDTIIWIGAMIVMAAIGIWLWPSLWSAPFFIIYGVLYGSGGDSRWHECGHGTAFKTPWMNTAVYEIASFCMMRNSATWRWSHARHHTDTVIVGRDPEIAVMRPPAFIKVLANFVGVFDAASGLTRMVYNALGRVHPEEAVYIPAQEQYKVIRVARISVAIYGLTIGLAIWTGSILPLMVIGLPRLYGAWHHVMTGLLQHGGLADNVTDHRLNSRTVYMNRVSRFIYWNMNYHVEHHMFPMVPYHALPALHAKIKHDLPAPNLSIAQGFAEMWPALRRQLANEDYFIQRALPPTAQPYRTDFHAAALGSAAK